MRFIRDFFEKEPNKYQVFAVSSLGKTIVVHSFSLITLCGSMYSAYNVLEFDSRRENCLLASVAAHDLVGAISWAFWGVTFGVLGVIFSKSFPAIPVVKKAPLLLALVGCVVAFCFALSATENMAQFIRHSRQPVIEKMHGPLAGYHCPK